MSSSGGLTYPASDLERPEVLQATLGTFWTDVFENQTALLALLEAKAQQGRCNWTIVERLADCRSRLTLPLYRQELLYPVVLVGTAPPATPRLGNEQSYGDGTLLGTPVTGPFEQTPGGGFLSAALLTDGTYQTGLALVEGLDYQSQPDGTLHCLEVLDGTYLGWDVRFDDRLPWLFLGSIVGLGLPTSQQALALYQSVADAAINGPSHATLVSAISALAGCDIQALGEETVEDVAEDSRGWLVATDKNVYRLPADAVPAVSVGQYLRGGENLSDAVRLVEAVDLPADVTSLTVPAVYLDQTLTEPVIFAGGDTALIVEEDVDGKTKVSWSGTGSGGAAFFDLLHARGVAADQTLANYLDVRSDPTDEPGAASLPATIDPLRLLLDTVWGSRNILVLLVKPALLDSTLDTDWNEVLRRVMAPHTTVLQVDL